MNYTEAKAKKKEIDEKVSQLGEVLRSYPKNESGLTPDEVKFSDAYRLDKARFNVAFEEQRQFNQAYVKQYKKELALERKNKRLALNNGTC